MDISTNQDKFPYPELLFYSVQFRENAEMVMSVAKGVLEELLARKLAVFLFVMKMQ